MQATTVFLSESLPFKAGFKSLVVPKILAKPQRTVSFSMVVAASAKETSTVDYSSTTSVFPAEACDTIGGEACSVDMFPEAKPETPITNTKANVSSEEVERDYMEYSEPKTVFPGEACDDLGGEFCEPEYQKGVFVENA
ncbi:uncharacterized protein A4U43_C10F4320 [Asparagus officinalis]|uniref:Light-regulated protein n=1 Tax=Asparagus officinalis TaxID=4686 RepID=A0A5P1E127_ASPOF|nr:light-regulated protein-like [Asparagus officinalis]ONK56119.1 uncharacterized protein A4U43_C10F4320 [Asparagus officinalis]